MHTISFSRVGVNPVLKKGLKNAYPRKNEIVYNHLRLGEAVVLADDEYHHKGWTRCEWSCACQGVKKDARVKHLLFECEEYAEERKRMKEALREEEEKRTKEALERGGSWHGSAWGKLTLLEESPGIVMGFLGDALGDGHGRVVEVC